jgi:hypothetical protein
VLGPIGNPLGNNGIRHLNGYPSLKAAGRVAKKQEQQPNQSLEHNWSELPYAMMRITAARRPWDGNRVYWRDRTVQLGEIDLRLVKIPAQDDSHRYTALYTQEELRRSFPLHPSLEDGQLLWSAPGISDAQLTTDQLAEKLLSKLITFYTTGLTNGLPKPSPTSSASPDLSS